MPQTNEPPPSFNLWIEPWITVEYADGVTQAMGLEQVLLQAHTYRAIYDPSPLVVVGIHRLLTAILQDIIRPEYEDDLIAVWEAGAFSADAIRQFGAQYGHRFDLFSADTPFLQSADIPLHPAKKGQGKSVGYLLAEQPAGTAVTHYNHTYDADQVFCAPCSAKGLLTIPSFASSGGAGIKPSINGVPPIYVLPGGRTYFESLAMSLVTPSFQPAVAAPENDTPWWRHDPIVPRSSELLRVGYLHSLTFPARRVRLHPEPMTVPCSRCGSMTTWGVAEMAYEMGESRPKDAAFWQDPFAAYRLATGKSDEGKNPTPIRPVEGRATWREFAGLFLPQTNDGRAYLRPRILEQLEQYREWRRTLPYKSGRPMPFQTVGLRTDMKMKIFEWELNGFQVPPTVLTEAASAEKISRGIKFAGDCDAILKSTFDQHFGGKGQTKRHSALKQRMSQAYWEQLGNFFQQFVLDLGETEALDARFHSWLEDVLQTAVAGFTQFANLIGDDAHSLRERVEGTNHCRAKLYKYRKDQYPKEV